MAFLKTNLLVTQNWLMDKTVVGEFSNDGILDRIQNLQKAALRRFLSPKQLNAIQSSWATLPGSGLSAKGLIDQLVNDLCVKQTTTPDLLERNLQLFLVEQLKKLTTNDDLNPTLKAEIEEALALINRWAKRMRKTASSSQKAHYNYVYRQTVMD